MTELTKDQIKACKYAIQGLSIIHKELDKEYIERGSATSVQNFGLIRQDYNIFTEPTAICLAAWRYKNSMSKGSRAVFQYPNVRPKYPSDYATVEEWLEAREAWITYVFDPVISPWRSVIHWDTTYEGEHIYRPQYVLDVGYIHLHNDPIVPVAHLMMALRDPCEFPNNVILWYRLVTRGCNPHFAFLFTRAYMIFTDDQIISNQIFHTHTVPQKATVGFFKTMKKILASNFSQNDLAGTGLLHETNTFTTWDSCNNVWKSTDYGNQLELMQRKYHTNATVTVHTSLRPHTVAGGKLRLDGAVAFVNDLEKEYYANV